MKNKLKMKTATFKHVESELFNYHHTVKLLKQRREEILYKASQTDENVGGGKSNIVGDPTSNKAIALVMDKRLAYLEEIVSMMDNVINQLPSEKIELIKIRYWTHPQTLNWEGIGLKLNISSRTAKRWREDIIQSIALYLGWE